MTPTMDIKTIEGVMEVLGQRGVDGMADVMRVLLNEAMKLEREEAVKAKSYERTPDRLGYANGFKSKTLNTRLGRMTVQIPQVRGLSFYPKSLEKGCRSERALKLAIAEMYVNGVSTRRVSEITEKLCGLDISSTQVSRLSKVLDEEVKKFATRALKRIPYLILDARYERIRVSGCVRDCAVLIATGVNTNGKREVLGVSVALSEAEVHWREFLQSLTARGLHGVEYIVSDSHEGLKAAKKAVFPKAIWQRCQFHFQQNAQAYSPKKSMRKEIAQDVRDIFNCANRDDAELKKMQVIDKYKDSAPAFSKWLELNVDETLNAFSLPRSFQVKLRTSNSLENLNREIRRRTQIASIFPNVEACTRLIGAVLVEIHEDWIVRTENYLNMKDKTDEELKSQTFTIYRKKVA
ncbi:MAG: IS256 family transposase [Bdellovibrionales bacterium]|nr:IS256 family transposase [Bdellovibrionales bacterium]